ncbi:MAG: uroporphyrinogen-III C-methyltransferase [Pyrinomonadaceae bacterium]|nr:uroporphyrinogen-III C-methyltransferase [Pyrinomonadaceae bacterium]
MRNDVKCGVLVVGHGSRRKEANRDVREAAIQIGKCGGFPLVQAAFLEIEQPDISAGFKRLVQEGAGSITVHPYFLSPGRHTRGDLPREVGAVAADFPDVSYRITEPLAAHPFVIAASVERILETIDPDRSKAPDAASYVARQGTVYLVGAGPGDPGLLTVKARDLLCSCEVVIYDYLVNPEILRQVPTSTERIYVGKVGGGRQTPQDRINTLLIENALNGKRVVRLKGGDPFLFGRGGEEAGALRAAGVSYEVVPGISSALGVATYAGIPLTHRGLSSSVAVVTGARGGDGAHERGLFRNLAAADTIVVLMGLSHLREIAHDLTTAGRSEETPVAVVRWGTYEGQQTVTGTLGTIAVQAERAGMRAPAVIVVGEVVRLRERLKWFEESVEGANAEDLEAALAVAC